MTKEKQKNLKERIKELNERQKELNCLYTINGILRDVNAPLGQIFQDILETIPPGWQHPDICTACIVYQDKTYKLDNFKHTELKQSAKIHVDESVVGEIQVYYTKPIRSEKKPIFLFEEQKLLNTIAEEIGKFLTTRRLKDLLQVDEKLDQKLKIPAGLDKWLSELNLSNDEIEKMLTTKINFKKNEAVFKQGSIASFMVILTKGLVKAHVEDISDRKFAFKIISTYEIIGLSSLFGKGRYGFSVSTLTPAEGYLVEKT